MPSEGGASIAGGSKRHVLERCQSESFESLLPNDGGFGKLLRKVDICIYFRVFDDNMTNQNLLRDGGGGGKTKLRYATPEYAFPGCQAVSHREAKTESAGADPRNQSMTKVSVEQGPGKQHHRTVWLICEARIERTEPRCPICQRGKDA